MLVDVGVSELSIEFGRHGKGTFLYFTLILALVI